MSTRRVTRSPRVNKKERDREKVLVYVAYHVQSPEVRNQEQPLRSYMPAQDYLTEHCNSGAKRTGRVCPVHCAGTVSGINSPVGDARRPVPVQYLLCPCVSGIVPN